VLAMLRGIQGRFRPVESISPIDPSDATYWDSRGYNLGKRLIVTQIYSSPERFCI